MVSFTPSGRNLARVLLLGAVAGVPLAASAGHPTAGSPTVVSTEAGAVRGVVRNGALEFRGIPYAAPPTGQRRWAQPTAAQPWSGLRDASAFGPACPQEARFGITERSENEDCLSLNVSVPADRKPGERLPVLVYIHGGAFVGGSSNLYRLDRLAREGRLVVVSPNYRVGVFGFMAHPALASNGFNGNYGLEDQRFALAWVRRNVAAFGGDQGNVTIGGESAGAGSICMHLATPERSKGLFDKAFILSAGCFSRLKTTAEAQDSGAELARLVGCGMSLDPAVCLRSRSVATWLAAQGQYAQTDPSDLIAISPSVGDRSLPRFPRDAAENGAIVEVPVLMGGARHELRLYVAYAVQAGYAITAANYPKALRLFYGDKEPQVAAQYPPGASPPATYGSVLSSYNPKLSINNCAYLRTADSFRARMPVYEFEFADNRALVLGVGIAPPDPGFALGAVHSAALNDLFPNYSNTSRINAPELEAASQKLASTMVASLASFARSGQPNGTGLPAWPVYRGGATVMLWDTPQPRPYDASAYHRCDFWRQLYPAQLGLTAQNRPTQGGQMPKRQTSRNQVDNGGKLF